MTTVSEHIKSELLELKKNMANYRELSRQSGLTPSRLWRMFNDKGPIDLRAIEVLELTGLINPMGQIKKGA